MKIREMIEKADDLMEQGDEAKRTRLHFQQAAASARSQLQAAYAQLEAASETGEGGEPKGDAAEARAAVYAAQVLLRSAEQGLSDASRRLDSVNGEKQEMIAEIERYQEAEGGNISVLRQLQSKRFGGNAAAFAQDILDRMNAGEKARQQLLASLGISAAAKAFPSGGSAPSPGLSSLSPPGEGFFGKKDADPGRSMFHIDFSGFVQVRDRQNTAARETDRDIPVKSAEGEQKEPNDIRKHPVQDFNGLSAYMNTHYGIQLDSSMGQLELATVKDAISGLEKVVSEYPEVGELLSRGITSSSGVMSCTGTVLSFNPAYFSDRHTLAETCRKMSAQKFWVPNSSPHTIGVHEAAHGVEWALIQANSQYKTHYERVVAWNGGAEAKKIVEEACRNIKKTPYGQNKSLTELIRSISAYALTNNSETMAEAFADVDANGDNANPLSIEIKRLTRVRMNQYKGGE